MPSMLPYGRQSIEDDDVAAMVDALRSDMLTTGPRVEEFERAFAVATGGAHAVACNSGTAALHLAAMGIGLGAGRAAVVPAVTFVATANAVRMTGAEVVIADVDPRTGLMTEETLTEALARGGDRGRVTAAFPVHLNGQVCATDSFARLPAAAGLDFVEDACHALGVPDIARTVARAVCFSTHPVKAIATGEGGVVITEGYELGERMRRLRSHGITRDAGAYRNHGMAYELDQPCPWFYEAQELGWNYRMPDLLCALGVAQLGKLSRFMARRYEIAVRYERLLAPVAPVLRPVSRAGNRHGWHLYVVRIDFKALGLTRTQVMNTLREQGIGTQVHYIPVHRQSYYRERYGDITLPGAEAYYAQCLSIPMYPGLTDDDVDRVAAALTAIVQGGRLGT